MTTPGGAGVVIFQHGGPHAEPLRARDRARAASTETADLLSLPFPQPEQKGSSGAD